MKIYSDPVRRFDKRGSEVVTETVSRGDATTHRIKRRCYRGWFLRWYDRGTGKRGWDYAGETLEQARKCRLLLQERELRGDHAVEEVPFEKAADQFLVWKRGELAPSSDPPLEDYKKEATAWLQELHRRLGKLKGFFSGKPVHEIQPRDIERYFSRRKGGAKTKNEDLSILRALLGWARKHGNTRVDATEGMKKWKLPRRQVHILTREEEVHLLKACREKYTVEGIRGLRNRGGRKRAILEKEREAWSQTFMPPPWLCPSVLLGLRTALRLGSIMRLEWRHVDFTRNVLRIDAEETKNKADLEIPMHPDVTALLKDLRGKAKKLNPLPARLLEACGAAPRGRRQVARAFARAVARAKLPEGFTFHGLRRVAATRMLQAGADLRTVMAVGGWNDPSTLLRLYAQATPESKVAAVEKL